MKWQSRGITFDTLPVYQANSELDIDRKKIEDFFNRRNGRPKVKVTEELLEAYDIHRKEHGKVFPSAA